ncbi:Gfo/Idh/MocA family oxidoreductase [Streptomyces sp. NPDC056503]|uniref:Gfo/Idh/MocA family oxidoreductase n=1 Tax=Streptomyces sp. NPDC056503 TaxID=3345842 RepID=UPI0036BE8F6D
MTDHRTLRIALAGGGAFGARHAAALRLIEGVEVTAVVSSSLERARKFAAEQGVGRAAASLDEVLAMDDVDAVVLAAPTQTHAAQTLACLEAGKHVQVEIPLGDSLADAEACVAAQERTGLVAMVGHTRRFDPSHPWVRRRIEAGEFDIQQMDVQTHFFRRRNLDALGEPRSWTDHLLWHHAAHTVDLFAYRTGSPVVRANAARGPIHPEPGIARDGIELQDREFVAAIREGREPHSSVAQVLACYRTPASLEERLIPVAAA